jgi:hypothetical protein
MNCPTDRLTPEHFAKAINGSIETILREECERLEGTIVCQLRNNVRARLKQLVPIVRATLARHVFDLELKIDVRVDGEPITPTPAQPVLHTPHGIDEIRSDVEFSRAQAITAMREGKDK